MTERDKTKIQASEMKFIRNTLGCSIIDRNKNVDIRMELGVDHCWNSAKCIVFIDARNNRKMKDRRTLSVALAGEIYSQGHYSSFIVRLDYVQSVSYTHLDVYKRQV